MRKTVEFGELTFTKQLPLKSELVCDRCKKVIETYIAADDTITLREHSDSQKYWKVTTGHYDWDNDSCYSIEKRDFCSFECLTEDFLKYALLTNNDKYNGSQYYNIEVKYS